MAHPSLPFLSSIVFGSYLVYPSSATGKEDQDAKSFILGVKQDRVTARGRLIEIAVTELKRNLPRTPLGANLFDGSAMLVPMPNHGLRTKNGVWAAASLADVMVAEGLAASVVPCIERVTPIRKAAYCPPEMRPSPREHYDTMAVQSQGLLRDVLRIVMVDDLVTRGSTFSGAAVRLREAFPQASIRAFGLARTAKMLRWRDPIVGAIHTSADGEWAERIP